MAESHRDAGERRPAPRCGPPGRLMRPVVVAAGAGLVMFSAASATADPAPPDPVLIVPTSPADAPPPPAPGALAAPQVTSNPLSDLLAGASAGALLAQTGPAVDPLAPIGLLMPQNFGMPTGEESSPYMLGENEPSPFARLDAFQGAHALLHSALGRIPGDQLGQPLPGTAPPPGTALPPGLAQYFPDPTVPPDPGAPADPVLLEPPAPN